jgi:uncharacterized delta-60 repeat protein
MMKNKVLFLASLLITALSWTLQAQPGSFDPNFAGNGVLYFNYGSDGSYAQDILVDDDGIIWIAGYRYNSAQQMGLSKILPDGNLDTSFDFDGSVGVNIEGGTAAATRMAMQEDGKIVLVGYSEHNGGDFGAARFNPDGSLDNSFGGGDGRLTIDFASSDYAAGVAIQEDGKIVLAGYTYESSQYKFALARLNQDGTLDANFDGDGKLTTAFSGEDAAFDLRILDDGKILVAGYNQVGTYYDYALARYNPDGSLDLSFGTNGVVTVDVNDLFETAQSMDIQADGKILLGGWSGDGMASVRFNPDGTLDNSYSFDGETYTVVGTYASGADIIAQPDGKVLLAGYGYDDDNGVYGFAIVRYLNDGLLDPEFGENGILLLDIAEDLENDFATGIALQPDGMIVVTGYSSIGGESQTVVIRILSGLNVGVFEHGLDNIQSFVYPNPLAAGETLQLEYELREATEVDINLYDLTGKQFPLFSGYRTSGNQAEAITLPASLPAGVYNLQIRTQKGISNIRVELF